MAGSLPRLALQLLLFAGVHLNLIVLGQGPVRKNITCTFEPSSPRCDWRLLETHSGINTSVVPAGNGPRLGPSTDVNPGTAQGHYFYFSSNQQLSTEERVLTYPSNTHQFTCALSFSYYAVGPLELEVLQANLAIHSIFMPSQSMANQTQWERAHLDFNTSDTYSGSLVIIASNFELGEAAPEPGSDSDDVFLAIDDIILTLCLPCDYDSLGDVGSVIVDGPERIDVSLRLVHQYQFNASSSVCPNETFTYAIESVQPNHVSPIFSIDPDTGLLTVNGRGSYLDANGTSGMLNVSVYVASSNYSETSSVHKTILVIPFHQPPTITHTAPPTYDVTVGNVFTYSFTVMSSLDGDIIDLGQPMTTPPELINNITITSQQDFNPITISGTISIDGVLPSIVLQGTPATISLPIEDVTNRGVVYVETQLMLRPSPPLFNQSTYEYSISEDSGNRFLGPFAVIDPNSDSIPTPSTNTSLFTIISHVSDDNLPRPYIYFDIVIFVQLNYEQQSMFSFTMTVTDSVSSTLSSTAMVTVNVLPINEHPPQFLINHKEVTISDTKPVGSIVTDFEATDADVGQDGRIDYTITAGNQDGFFGISGAGFGEVIVQRTLILPYTFTLTITATDRGTPPKSTNATLIIHVATSNEVDCSENDFGRPEITSPGMMFVVSRGDNVTMNCQYMSNPVGLYKWQYLGRSIFLNDTDRHYMVTRNTLSIYNITPDDASFYICNVTNQCGSNSAPYTLQVVDYPNAPSDLNFTRPADTNSIGLSWTGAPVSAHGFVSTPLDGYIVQTRINRKTLYFSDLMELGASVTEANVTGLFPGTEYDIRVVSINQAGRTPSESVTFNTIPNVPKIAYLDAVGLANGSILLEWRLEYDGGHPISNFEIHISVGSGRARRDTTTPDFVFHTDVNRNQLVTGAMTQGQTYNIRATASNILGSSDPQTANAFVGHTDAVGCGYDDSDDTRGCPWQLGDGRIINAQSSGATNDLPSTDSDGNRFGHYVSATLDPIANESTLMTYNQAGYICGFSFSYFLSEGAGIVIRSNPSRREVWSSTGEAPPTGSWQFVNFTRAQRYLTSYFEEMLEIVLIPIGSRNASTIIAGAVDNLNVKFCLPCNFEDLQNATQFALNYANQTKIYLRQPQNLTIQAMLEECTQAVINFTITRVVPGDLLSRFSLTSTSGQSATVNVGPITPLLALPNTIGFVEVVATVAHSDYLFESSSVQRTALVEFVLLSTSQNCTPPNSCTFDESTTCKAWQLGSSSTITNSSLPPSITPTSGQYLNTIYPQRSSMTLQIASAIINDSFCAVSFLYICPASLELQVVVSGLGSVWSSVEGDRTTTSWVQETVEIDLQAVGVQVNRTLAFVISLAEGEDPLTSTDGYAALDNIILHPCFDCSAPECSFSTCFPGRYYSLPDESCVDCLQGYYCPNQWGLPQPCPPGTFSNAVNAASRSTCHPCSANTYAVKQASTSCQICPTGYNCSNSSSIPVAIDNGQYSCPTSPTTCQTSSPMIHTTMASTVPLTEPLLIAVGSIGGVILVLCLVLTCILTCFCLRAKRRRDKKIKRHNERRKFLLRDNLSIGTAGSLGASTMTSASSYDSRAGRRKVNKRGDVSTLLSFLSDEEPTEGSDPYDRETSWADTEQLTNRDGEPGESHSFVMRNGAFEDVTQDDVEDDHRGNELAELSGWQRSKGKKGHATTSLL